MHIKYNTDTHWNTKPTNEIFRKPIVRKYCHNHSQNDKELNRIEIISGMEQSVEKRIEEAINFSSLRLQILIPPNHYFMFVSRFQYTYECVCSNKKKLKLSHTSTQLKFRLQELSHRNIRQAWVACHEIQECTERGLVQARWGLHCQSRFRSLMLNGYACCIRSFGDILLTLSSNLASSELVREYILLSYDIWLLLNDQSNQNTTLRFHKIMLFNTTVSFTYHVLDSISHPFHFLLFFSIKTS